MKCIKCGMENAENVKFCTSCGEELLAENLADIPEEVSVDEVKEELANKQEQSPLPEQVSVEPQVAAVPPAPPISPQASQPKEPVAQPVQPTPQPVPPVPPVSPVQSAPQAAPQPVQPQAAPSPVAPQVAPVQPQVAPQPAQPQYQQVQPAQAVPMVEDKTVKPMTFGGWLWSLIVLMIPIVNFIFILVWSFSSGTNKSKKSFAQVLLLFTVINIILMIVFGVLVAAGSSVIDGVLDTAIDAAL